jgi:DNA-binding transcriptional LysR family regulator
MSKQKNSKVGLEHWRSLLAVVDHGGYAKAAEALGKSQSTVSHSIGRLEQLLGTGVLRVQGRKAVLTPVGEVVVRRTRNLLNEAADIERMARTLAAGVESEVNIAVDTIFPNQVLLPAIQEFADQYPGTRIELHETVISGIEEGVVAGQIQLAITPRVPQGWLGDHLCRLEMICVAHPQHPLHRLNRPVTEQDLMQHRHLVVRETSDRRGTDLGWLTVEQRLTVSTMSTRIQALCQGLGFAWSPVMKIRRELEAGLLKPLPLAHGDKRFVEMYMFFADEHGAGPATRALADAIRNQAALHTSSE